MFDRSGKLVHEHSLHQLSLEIEIRIIFVWMLVPVYGDSQILILLMKVDQLTEQLPSRKKHFLGELELNFDHIVLDLLFEVMYLLIVVLFLSFVLLSLQFEILIEFFQVHIAEALALRRELRHVFILQIEQLLIFLKYLLLQNVLSPLEFVR